MLAAAFTTDTLSDTIELNSFLLLRCQICLRLDHLTAICISALEQLHKGCISATAVNVSFGNHPQPPYHTADDL